jgi:hypothetical protein
MTGRALARLHAQVEDEERGPSLACLTCSLCGRQMRRCARCRSTTCSAPWCVACLVDRMDLPPTAAEIVLELLSGEDQELDEDPGSDL